MVNGSMTRFLLVALSELFVVKDVVIVEAEITLISSFYDSGSKVVVVKFFFFKICEP